MKNRFSILLSLGITILCILLFLGFSWLAQTYIYRALLEQAIKDNKVIGESILSLLQKMHGKDFEEDSEGVINSFQNTCDLIELPNKGFVCAVKDNGDLVAFPKLKKEERGKVNFNTSTRFANLADKTLPFNDTRKDLFIGLFQAPDQTTTDVIVKIRHKSGLHILVHQNKNSIAEYAQKHSQNLFYFGLLFSVLVGGVVYLFVHREVNIYQNKIEEQNKQLNKTLQLVNVERQKSDSLLLNILPEATAQELKETGQATPKYYELVSVLFTDFKGFTKMAEKLTPNQVIEALDTCFLAFDEICEKYNLEKIKTIGDSYMCVGGLPTNNKTNAFDAVQAGLAMQTWMTEWAKAKEEKGQESWELRIGIHSGEVIAGVIGKNKFAYDIWGDTVNLASRMESSGEVGKVNISEATYALVKDSFQCTHRGEIEAKSKGKIAMYFVEKILT